jgi:hypothetical protein
MAREKEQLVSELNQTKAVLESMHKSAETEKNQVKKEEEAVRKYGNEIEKLRAINENLERICGSNE